MPRPSNLGNMRKLGVRTIEIMEYGTGRTKKIRRTVYSEKTQAKGYFIYWVWLYRDQWINTARKGITSGFVVSQSDFPKIR